MSANPVEKRTAENRAPFIDATKIGDYAAKQPLSGINSVDESGSVNGMSHGGYLRTIRPEFIDSASKKD